MHRHRPVAVIRAFRVVCAAAALAGCAGAFAQASAPAATPAVPPPLTPQIINMGGMTADEIGPVIADALEDKPNPLGELFRIGNRLSNRLPPS